MNPTRLAAQLGRLAGTTTSFTLAGEEWELREDLTAADWIPAVLEDSYDAVVPGLMDPEDSDELFELVFDDDVEVDIMDCRTAGLQVYAACAGRTWFEANRLVVIAIDSWDHFDGWCVEKQLQPLTLPLDRFLNLVRRWLFAHTPEKEREDLVRRLEAAPAGRPEEMEALPEWSEEEMEAGFDAAMAMMGGR